MFLDKDIWRNEHEKTCKKTGGSYFGNDNGIDVYKRQAGSTDS